MQEPTSNNSASVFYRSCNFCGGTSFRVHKQTGAPFPERIFGDIALTDPEVGSTLKLQYVECEKCGLVFINPLTYFSDIDQKSFDGERNIVAWADLDYEFYEKDKRWTTEILYDSYDLDHYRKYNRLLDVGCGPGVALHWLRDVKGWDVWGIDPDRHSIRQANERYNLAVENGVIDDVDAPEEFFDLLIMDNSLEHNFDPVGALLRAFRLLRKGGGLLIFVPNCDGLGSKLTNLNVHWGHWFLFRPQVLCTVLWRIGYHIPRLIGLQNLANPVPSQQMSWDVDGSAMQKVIIDGDTEIKNKVKEGDICTDFFTLMAMKPAEAGVGSASEKELAVKASLSKVQRVAVHIHDSEVPQGAIPPDNTAATVPQPSTSERNSGGLVMKSLHLLLRSGPSGFAHEAVSYVRWRKADWLSGRKIC